MASKTPGSNGPVGLLVDDHDGARLALISFSIRRIGDKSFSDRQVYTALPPFNVTAADHSG